MGIREDNTLITKDILSSFRTALLAKNVLAISLCQESMAVTMLKGDCH